MADFTHIVIASLVRPYTLWELPGWGALYRCFIGSYERDEFWRNAGHREITGKMHGYRMRLDLSRWSDRSAYFLGRWYDLPAQLLVKEALKPGDAVVDVGANVGMFSLCASAAVGANGTVHAFEPNPNARKRLNHHLEINAIKNVEVHAFALHNASGSATIHVPHFNLGEGSLERLDYADDQVSTIEIEKKVGDEVLTQVNPRLVKIDVEGAEIGVLKGLRALITRARPVIVSECRTGHLKRFNHSPADLFALMEEYGYKRFQLGLKRAGLFGQRLALKENSDGDGDFAFIPDGDPLLGVARDA